MSDPSRVKTSAGPSPAPPVRRRLGCAPFAGAAVLAVMMLACLGSLPWTLGSVEEATASGASTTTRRYERSNLDLALLPPAWASFDADEQQRVDIWESSGRLYRSLFGTDRLGRDLFVRCLLGGAISLIIGLSAALISVVIGTIYGTLSAFAGGRVDAVMMRIVDIFYGLPYVLLVVLIAVAVDGVFGRLSALAEQNASTSGVAQWMLDHRQLINVATLGAAIGGVSWLTMARVIRGQVLSLREQPFMEASRAIGVPWRVQFVRHILPNLAGPIAVYATLTVPQAILQESFLSFLGIGIQPPLPSWGNLAAEGLPEMNPFRARWWLLLWPCVLLAITLLSLSFLGEGLREVLDPRRSGRPSRR